MVATSIYFVKAVQHVHAAGYVHHDIAPRNLLTDHPHPGVGKLKLIDFGLAARYRDDGFCTHSAWVFHPSLSLFTLLIHIVIGS
jgi:serine/threonine protein kinase